MGAVPRRAGGGESESTSGTNDQKHEHEHADSDDELDVGTVCEMLGNRRRRYVLHYLKQHEDGVVEMGELSTRVAAWERGVEPERVSYDERKTVHTALYQHHAPKLDENGLVEYDSRSGVVALTETGADVDLYLEAVRGRDVPWSSYLLGVSGVGVLVTLAAFLGAVPATVPPAAPGVAVAAAFLVSSAVFVYDSRHRLRLGREGPPPEVERERAVDADVDAGSDSKAEVDDR